MPFVNYELLNQAYPSGRMKENVQLLEDFNSFHCLLEGNSERAYAVNKRVPDLPADFQKWLNVCDGGILFDTAMMTTKSHDTELNLDFYTYSIFYKTELRQFLNLSEDWFVFAVAVHSDVFFFDMAKKDNQVYQWDIEKKSIYAFWSNFEDWLSDQIHEAIGLIADKLIMPVYLKMEGSNNE